MTSHDDDDAVPEMRRVRTDAIRESLLSVIRDEPSARARRVRRRLLIGGGIGALVVGAAVTAAAIILESAQVSNTELVHCLSSISRNADGTYPGSQATIAIDGGPGRVDDAVALCSQMWEQGVLGAGFEPGEASNPPGTVPALQVCVMRDGSAAVVPSDLKNICHALGLAPLE